MRETVRRWLPEVVVLGAAWVVVGGFAGLALGVIGAVGLGRWRRHQQASGVVSDTDALLAARQLPWPQTCWPRASRPERAR